MPAKKRNKKHNPMRGALASARVGLRHLAIWHSEKSTGDYTAEVINTKTLKSERIGQSTAFALNNIRHKWQILLLAIGEDNNGKKYFKVDPVQLKTEMLQSDLVEYLNKRHKSFIEKSFNKSHLTNVAWFAQPNGWETDRLSDEVIEKLIDKKEAW